MRFRPEHNRFFASHTGAYSVLTAREYYDSQLTLTGDEFDLANNFFGGRIHSGPVRANPVSALKQFKLYPTGTTIQLNLVYPKASKDELRLYLAERRGFKPAPLDVWFLFERNAELHVGSMVVADWTRIFRAV